MGERRLAFLAAVVAGCGGGSATPPISADAAVTPAPPDAAPPPPDAGPPDAGSPDAGTPDAALTPHRIATRVDPDGGAELYDRVSGETFLPRGANYVRLAPHLPDYPSAYHSTFDVGGYDAERAGSALADMRAFGYNAVRVFLNPQSSGVAELDRPAISRPYVANLVDFLRRAREQQIQVLITEEHIAGGYGTLLTDDERFRGFNLYFLSPSAVAAQRAFWGDLARALIDEGAPLDALLGYQLMNEVFFETDQPPLSLSTGTLTTANGSNYNLADAASRRRMLDEGLVYWADELRAAIVAVDPTALVTAGFFWPQDPNPSRVGDPRFIDPYPAIERSTLDFVDLHVYADTGLTLPQMFENFKLTGAETKPIVMGEFGASDREFPTAAEAVAGLRRWIADSCDGGFRGWLLWTWDSTELEDSASTWYARRDNDAVGRGLSPGEVPDPCAGGRRRTRLEVATSGSTVSGRLTNSRQAGLAGQTVRLELAPAEGQGEVATYTLSGNAPATARSVLVGLRANLECSCAGDVDVRFYLASYRQGGGANIIGNPDFAGGLAQWGSWGTGSVTIEASDRGAGSMLHALATPAQDIGLNSFDYQVTPGAAYQAAFEARIPPSSAPNGFFLMAFLDQAQAVIQTRTIPFAAPTATFTATTDVDGRFSFDAGASAAARRGRVVYAGSDTTWEASAAVSLTAP